MANDVILFKEKMTNLITAKQSDILGFLNEKAFNRFKSSLINILSSDSTLINFSPENIFTLAFNLAQRGDLSLNKAFGEAYLVPYNKELSLVVGYKGWLKLAKRAGKNVRAFIIYKDDKFSASFKDKDLEVVYEPNYDAERKKEDIKGVFICVYDEKDTQKFFVDKGTLKRIMVKSNLNSPAWRGFYEEMLLARAIKYVLTKMPLENNENLLSIADYENEFEAKQNYEDIEEVNEKLAQIQFDEERENV